MADIKKTKESVPEGWVETRLGDVAEKIAMGPFGSNIKVSTFVKSGIPVISGQHLKGHKLKDSDYNFLTKEHAEQLKNSKVFKGDVIFTHAGNIGQVAIIPETARYDEYIISQRQFYLRANKDLINPLFLTYYFKSRIGLHKLLSNKSQVGVPSIAQPSSHLKSILLNLPPLPEQQGITFVLSSLDDKIELLRDQNKTLEQTAQTIFKEWFGKYLVKDKLPEGWRIFKLSEIVDTINGYSYKGKELVQESESALVTLKSFDRNGGFQTRGFKPFSGNPKDSQEVQIGDLVVAHTDLTQDAEVLGNPAFIFDDGGFKKMYITMDLVKVVSKSNSISKSFLYYLMKDRHFKGHCVGYANGTTVLHLSKKAIPEYEMALPENKQKIIDFSEIADKTTEKITANIKQILSLTKTRDALLPKLMTGEIRVNLNK